MSEPTLSPHFTEFRRLEALRLILNGHDTATVAKALCVDEYLVQSWFEGQSLSDGAPIPEGPERVTKRIRGDQKRRLAPFLEAMGSAGGITVPSLRYLCRWLLGVTFELEVGEQALSEMGYEPGQDLAPLLKAGGSLGGERIWVIKQADRSGKALTPQQRRVELAQRMEGLVNPLLQDVFTEEHLALAAGSVETPAQDFVRAVSAGLVTHLSERAPSSLAKVCFSCADIANATLTTAANSVPTR